MKRQILAAAIGLLITCLAMVLATSKALGAPTQASDTLMRVPGSWLFGPQTVWSGGHISDYVFHPLSYPMASGDVISVRVDTLMDQDTGNCKLRPALRYSDDGFSWDDSQDIIATYQTGVGVVPGTSYVDLTSLGASPKAYIQFGVQVANESGTATEFCNAALRVQVKRT